MDDNLQTLDGLTQNLQQLQVGLAGEPEVPADFVPLRLVCLPGGQRLEFSKPHLIVGRHSLADIRLVLPDISRRHCRLTFDGGRWRVFDLKSMNGVYVNGERMQEATLYEGDHVRLGSFTCLIEQATPLRQSHVAGGNVKAEVLKSIVEVLPPREDKRCA